MGWLRSIYTLALATRRKERGRAKRGAPAAHIDARGGLRYSSWFFISLHRPGFRSRPLQSPTLAYDDRHPHSRRSLQCSIHAGVFQE